MEQSPSWEADIHSVKKLPPFIVPEGSLPCSLETATDPYPD